MAIAVAKNAGTGVQGDRDKKKMMVRCCRCRCEDRVPAVAGTVPAGTMMAAAEKGRQAGWGEGAVVRCCGGVVARWGSHKKKDFNFPFAPFPEKPEYLG